MPAFLLRSLLVMNWHSEFILELKPSETRWETLPLDLLHQENTSRKCLK